MQPRSPKPYWASVAILCLSSATFVAALEARSALVLGLGAKLTLATILAGFAIATWVAWAVALIVCGARIPLAKIASLPWRHRAETTAVFVLACSLAWVLADPRSRRLLDIYVAIVCLTGLLCALSHWLARAQPPVLALALAIGMALAAMAADQYLDPKTYPELHDLLLLIGASASASALSRVSLGSLRRSYQLACLLAMPLMVLPLCFLAGALHSDWTRSAILDGSGVASLSRVLHSTVDLDRDGFSPLLGGGDCDDFDATRNPNALEVAGGGDANCNGASLPQQPSDSERGLTQAFGDAALDPAAIELFILITVDCWRNDAFSPELTPKLWQFARQGLVIERMYSAASETRNSLPLTQRAHAMAPWVSDVLSAHGVSNSSVSGGGIDTRVWGLSRRDSSRDAEQTTDLALAQIETNSQAPHYLWVHYYDLHETPRFTNKTAPPGVSTLPASYRAATAHVDQEVGRLLDGLRQEGRLERTAVLITADHGEGLGDHGVGSHARSGFESIIRVPGIFVAPGMPARSLPILGSHRDLPATILGSFGLDSEARSAEQFGRSWLRLRQADAGALHDFVVIRSARLSSGRRQDGPLAVMVDARYKLVAGVVVARSGSSASSQAMPSSASTSGFALCLYCR